jgi:hypothetical protein
MHTITDDLRIEARRTVTITNLRRETRSRSSPLPAIPMRGSHLTL